jgi:thiol-disulfide isomerase/thioredoxin
MKELFTSLALFVIFSVAFSGMTGCSSNATNTAPGGNTAVANTNSSNTSVSSKYPPVPSGLAEAPFELLDGTEKKISDYKGKVVMLNVWGIWCGPCRAEMPHLIELQDKYRDKGFEIIGLNIGDQEGRAEKVDAINKFSEEMKLNYTLARMAGTSIRQFYAVSRQEVVPQTILVDREGHLRAVFVGGGQNVYDSMNTQVDKTMAE